MKVKVIRKFDSSGNEMDSEYATEDGVRISRRAYDRNKIIKKSKKKAKKVIKSKVTNKLRKQTNLDFYQSKKWRSLRYRVLKKYNGCCMLCGESHKKHGIVLHVDHIKPRSKYPKLELSFENMQLLCEACNLGKSNTDDTDWRPDEFIALSDRDILECK